jgi:hypothetical protein
MHNVEHKIVGDKLVITIDIGKQAISSAPPSSSGRTFLVGTTGGQMAIPSNNCKALTFALNVMAKK